MLSLFCSQVNSGTQCFIKLEEYRHLKAALTDAVQIQAARKKDMMDMADMMCFSIQHKSALGSFICTKEKMSFCRTLQSN